MSIIKSILHKYNATSKAYDTLHPETETSQITDFDTAVNGKINTHNSSGAAHSTLFNQCEKTSSLANDIVTKLAQTTAISAISALQTNSLFGQLLKLVLNASGMKYLIAQNGYICFGSLFGGLIIQWGSVSIPASNKDREEILVSFPITVNAVVNVQSSCRSPIGITRAGDETRSTITIVRSGAWTAGSITVDWQVICK